MNETASLTRLWLIDWFGHIIDHDPVRNELIRLPFVSGKYPDLFLLSPFPLHLPTTAVFRKNSSVPHSLPDLEMIDAANNQIGLRDKARNTWFSINPRNELTHFNSEALMGWEKFSPMTLEMLNGLSNLVDPERATVLDEQNNPCKPLAFKPEGDNTAILQGFPFILGRNTDALIAIGSMEPESGIKVTLKGQGFSLATFTIQRKTDSDNKEDSFSHTPCQEASGA